MNFCHSKIFLLFFFVLVSCTANNREPYKELAFKDISFSEENIKRYSLSKEFVEIRGVEFKTNISVAEIEGYPLQLLFLSNKVTCGASNCSLNYYKEMSDGALKKDSSLISAKRGIYQLTCGVDLYLIHYGVGALGHGVWKYTDNDDKYFEHIYNTKDFAMAVSCEDKL